MWNYRWDNSDRREKMKMIKWKKETIVPAEEVHLRGREWERVNEQRLTNLTWFLLVGLHSFQGGAVGLKSNLLFKH